MCCSSLRAKHWKNAISSGGTPGYFGLIIRREGENVLSNTILLHAAALVEKVHLVHLLLVLRLQLILLSGKPSLKLIHLLLLSHESGPELLHLLLQFKILLFGFFELDFYDFTFLPQLVRIDENHFLLSFNQLQSLGSLHNSFLNSGKITFRPLQFYTQLFTIAHMVKNESHHGLSNLQLLKK